MSKLVQSELLDQLHIEFSEKRPELLMQLLKLLENASARSKNEKMVRISAELSNILNNEKNYDKISKCENLSELLETLDGLNKENSMFKIYESEKLQKEFPHLAARKFL